MCAEKVKTDFIITKDARSFAKAKVDALNSTDFFEMLQRDYDLTYDSVEF